MATKTKVATKEVAVKTQLPAGVLDYGEDSGKGYEGQTSKDLSLPWINVLQDGSPQVKDKESHYVSGMLYNTVTHEGVEGKVGMVIIPVHKRRVFVEWVPRDNGGGWVAVHEVESDVVAKAIADSTAFGKYSVKGNDLVETFELYFLILDPEDLESESAIGFGVIAITSKKIKPFKDWTTALSLVNYRKFGIAKQPPIFANRVKLLTFTDKHKTFVYENVKFQPLNPDTAELPGIMTSLLGKDTPLYNEAKNLREMIQKGMAKVDYSTQAQDTPTEEADDKF
jgi:hypothetical protein